MKAEMNHPDLTTTSIVAKLLARENITILKGNYQTASFDTINRVLYLPLFNNTLNKDCADMFVGHEVGHALYTPADTIADFRQKYPNVPFSFLNIVEDVRIERMIQETYPGMITCFLAAYKDLIAQDIFKIQGRNLHELNFADRLNLHAKIGTLKHIPLNETELNFYKKCYAAKTMDEVILLAVELATMVKAEKSEDASPDGNSSGDNISDETFENPEQSEEQSEEQSDPTGQSESEDKDSAENKSNDSQSPGNTKAGKESSDKDDFVSETEKAISDFFQNNTEKREFNILSAPPRDVSMATVTPYSKLKDYREKALNHRISMNLVSKEQISHYDSLIAKLLASLELEANVLVSEFNMRKSAANYQKTSQARTGNIDTNLLHRYKIADDIFKTLSIEPNEQNHGMVMFVDYSGSMRNGDAITSVLRQTITLALFCRKLSIPFDVYGFTTGAIDESERAIRTEKLTDRTVLNRVSLRYDTKVFNLVSSCLSSSDFKTAIKNLAGLVVTHFNYEPCYNVTEGMGGTPLLETMIVAHDIVKDFRIKHKVQNMNVVFLTDGEGGDLSTMEYTTRHRTTYMMLHGRQIMFKSLRFEDVYSALIENLRITQGCKVQGYFVVSSLNAANKICSDAEVKAIRSEGFVSKELHGYDDFFVVKMSEGNIDGDITRDISENLTINQITRSMLSAGKNVRKSKGLLRTLAKSFAV